ncbi:MAG TPA: response regulator [Bryobacteraceae bacterium]|jgi:CheY-like chemotaxis protein|nr:response regulator [Bryobacteraceae bacterium]
MPDGLDGQRTRTILYLEDDDTAAYLFELTVGECPDAKAAVQVHRVVNADQAFAFLFHEVPYRQAPRPDVVVLDINVPGANTGLTVLKTIRSNPALACLPVVMFSGSNASADREQASKLGADEYVIKSDFETFVTAAETAVRLAG